MILDIIRFRSKYYRKIIEKYKKYNKLENIKFKLEM